MNDCFWECAKAHEALERGDVEEAKRILAYALDREAPPTETPQKKSA